MHSIQPHVSHRIQPSLQIQSVSWRQSFVSVLCFLFCNCYFFRYYCFAAVATASCITHKIVCKSHRTTLSLIIFDLSPDWRSQCNGNVVSNMQIVLIAFLLFFLTHFPARSLAHTLYGMALRSFIVRDLFRKLVYGSHT